MKYDDVTWYCDGDLASDLQNSSVATCTGMFIAWLLKKGFASQELDEDFFDDISSLQNQEITGAVFMVNAMDGKFTDNDLSDEGNKFTVAYYQGNDGDSLYVDDYLRVFGVDLKNIFLVVDDLSNYEKISQVISSRYNEWCSMNRPSFMAAQVFSKKLDL